MNQSSRRIASIAMLLLLFSVNAWSETATIAIAANFSGPAKQLQAAFQMQHQGRLRLVFGSSGKLLAQVMQGAPFDVFLSADEAKARRIEQSDFGIQHSRFEYARGRLVLWSAKHHVSLAQALGSAGAPRLVIANPALAPYGLAARQVLQNMNLWEARQSTLIVSENISQAFHFAKLGVVDAAFLAHSQWLVGAQAMPGQALVLDESLHAPISQHGLLLRHGQHNATAQAFVHFLKSEAAQCMIAQLGYRALIQGPCLNEL